MRKLASIQTVNAIEPIPNADAIEKIRVLGWWVVVKKGDHKSGDKVVYCEIDSLLPERPEFEFLRTNSFKPAQVDDTGTLVQRAGFHIKTVKLRGQVSQGICFPLLRAAAVAAGPKKNPARLPSGAWPEYRSGLRFAISLEVAQVGNVQGQAESLTTGVLRRSCQLPGAAINPRQRLALLLPGELEVGAVPTWFHLLRIRRSITSLYRWRRVKVGSEDSTHPT